MIESVTVRTHYDHVGIRASIFENDTCGLEERVSKARRTLNAISGLGIRQCGLTIRTCNTIFWSVVVPIAMYGCELLILTEKHVAILEEFQEYAGRRLQRFHVKTPRVCAFYALGWIRLERYIEVKKQNKSHESLILIERVCHTPRYLVWWELSDIFPDKMGKCEIMSKLVCRCSLLKADDVRLKNLTAFHRWCEHCELCEVEDAKHLILNCPETQSQRDEMMG